MKATKIAAIVAVATATLALPAATARGAAVQDSYTVTVSPTSALPGASVHVTATDSFTDGSQCDLSPYTISFAYTKVGGGEANAQVGSGTTDSDDAHVDADITVPDDAASTAASGVTGSVSLNVSCGNQPQIKRSTSAVVPAVFNPSATPAALTVAAFTGTVKTNPTFAFRGTDVDVTLNNCRGGSISSGFTSYGNQKTSVDVSNYDAATNTASGMFTVAGDTTFGPGAVSGLCWQTNYSAKKLFISNAEEEGVGEAGGTTHGKPPTPVAKHAHPVSATPTFTG